MSSAHTHTHTNPVVFQRALEWQAPHFGETNPNLFLSSLRHPNRNGKVLKPHKSGWRRGAQPLKSSPFLSLPACDSSCLYHFPPEKSWRIRKSSSVFRNSGAWSAWWSWKGLGGAHTCFVLGGEKEGLRGATSAQPQLRASQSVPGASTPQSTSCCPGTNTQVLVGESKWWRSPGSGGLSRFSYLLVWCFVCQKCPLLPLQAKEATALEM